MTKRHFPDSPKSLVLDFSMAQQVKEINTCSARVFIVLPAPMDCRAPAQNFSHLPLTPLQCLALAELNYG